MAIATINPANGQTVKTFTPHTAAEVDAKLELATKTFKSFRHLPFSQRGGLVPQSRRDSRTTPNGICPTDDPGNGQANQTGDRRSQ